MNLSEMYKITKKDISLGDYILIDYDLFFSEENMQGYSRFAIDEKSELEMLMSIMIKLRERYVDAELYICAYGNELEDNKGIKFIYGDSVWITSGIETDIVTTMFNEYMVIEPSDIRNLSDMDEIRQQKIFCFMKNGKVTELVETKSIKKLFNTLVLNWD